MSRQFVDLTDAQARRSAPDSMPNSQPPVSTSKAKAKAQFDNEAGARATKAAQLAADKRALASSSPLPASLVALCASMEDDADGDEKANVNTSASASQSKAKSASAIASKSGAATSAASTLEESSQPASTSTSTIGGASSSAAPKRARSSSPMKRRGSEAGGGSNRPSADGGVVKMNGLSSSKKRSRSSPRTTGDTDGNSMSDVELGTDSSSSSRANGELADSSASSNGSSTNATEHANDAPAPTKPAARFSHSRSLPPSPKRRKTVPTEKESGELSEGEDGATSSTRRRGESLEEGEIPSSTENDIASKTSTALKHSSQNSHIPNGVTLGFPSSTVVRNGYHAPKVNGINGYKNPAVLDQSSQCHSVLKKRKEPPSSSPSERRDSHDNDGGAGGAPQAESAKKKKLEKNSSPASSSPASVPGVSGSGGVPPKAASRPRAPSLTIEEIEARITNLELLRASMRKKERRKSSQKNGHVVKMPLKKKKRGLLVHQQHAAQKSSLKLKKSASSSQTQQVPSPSNSSASSMSSGKSNASGRSASDASSSSSATGSVSEHSASSSASKAEKRAPVWMRTDAPEGEDEDDDEPMAATSKAPPPSSPSSSSASPSSSSLNSSSNSSRSNPEQSTSSSSNSSNSSQPAAGALKRERWSTIKGVTNDLVRSVWGELNELRQTLSRKAGVKAELILSDGAMALFAVHLPHSIADTENVAGVGSASHTAEFIDLITEFATRNAITRPPRGATPPVPAKCPVELQQFFRPRAAASGTPATADSKVPRKRCGPPSPWGFPPELQVSLETEYKSAAWRKHRELMQKSEELRESYAQPFVSEHRLVTRYQRHYKISLPLLLALADIFGRSSSFVERVWDSVEVEMKRPHVAETFPVEQSIEAKKQHIVALLRRTNDPSNTDRFAMLERIDLTSDDAAESLAALENVSSDLARQQNSFVKEYTSAAASAQKSDPKAEGKSPVDSKDGVLGFAASDLSFARGSYGRVTHFDVSGSLSDSFVKLSAREGGHLTKLEPKLEPKVEKADVKPPLGVAPMDTSSSSPPKSSSSSHTRSKPQKLPVSSSAKLPKKSVSSLSSSSTDLRHSAAASTATTSSSSSTPSSLTVRLPAPTPQTGVPSSSSSSRTPARSPTPPTVFKPSKRISAGDAQLSLTTQVPSSSSGSALSQSVSSSSSSSSSTTNAPKDKVVIDLDAEPSRPPPTTAPAPQPSTAAASTVAASAAGSATRPRVTRGARKASMARNSAKRRRFAPYATVSDMAPPKPGVPSQTPTSGNTPSTSSTSRSPSAGRASAVRPRFSGVIAESTASAASAASSAASAASGTHASSSSSQTHSSAAMQSSTKMSPITIEDDDAPMLPVGSTSSAVRPLSTAQISAALSSPWSSSHKQQQQRGSSLGDDSALSRAISRSAASAKGGQAPPPPPPPPPEPAAAKGGDDEDEDDDIIFVGEKANSTSSAAPAASSSKSPARSPSRPRSPSELLQSSSSQGASHSTPQRIKKRYRIPGRLEQSISYVNNLLQKHSSPSPADSSSSSSSFEQGSGSGRIGSLRPRTARTGPIIGKPVPLPVPERGLPRGVTMGMRERMAPGFQYLLDQDMLHSNAYGVAQTRPKDWSYIHEHLIHPSAKHLEVINDDDGFLLPCQCSTLQNDNSESSSAANKPSSCSSSSSSSQARWKQQLVSSSSSSSSTTSGFRPGHARKTTSSLSIAALKKAKEASSSASSSSSSSVVDLSASSRTNSEAGPFNGKVTARDIVEHGCGIVQRCICQRESNMRYDTRPERRGCVVWPEDRADVERAERALYGKYIADFDKLAREHEGDMKDDADQIEPHVVECHRKCPCTPGICPNRVVQLTALGVKRLQIKSFGDKGLGVVTRDYIKKGQYVVAYLGEIIAQDECMKRERRHAGLYIWDEGQIVQNSPVLPVDATLNGNIARFVNHSCEPNMRAVRVYFGNNNVYLPNIGFFAARSIKSGEELTIDYHWESVADPGNNPALKRNVIRCLCLSKSCRRWMKVSDKC